MVVSVFWPLLAYLLSWDGWVFVVGGATRVLANMMNQIEPETRLYIPFGEMVAGNHFVIHRNHHPIGETRNPVFVKTSWKCYKDTKTGDVFLLRNTELYRTWVSQVD